MVKKMNSSTAFEDADPTPGRMKTVGMVRQSRLDFIARMNGSELNLREIAAAHLECGDDCRRASGILVGHGSSRSPRYSDSVLFV